MRTKKLREILLELNNQNGETSSSNVVLIENYWKIFPREKYNFKTIYVTLKAKSRFNLEETGEYYVISDKVDKNSNYLLRKILKKDPSTTIEEIKNKLPHGHYVFDESYVYKIERILSEKGLEELISYLYMEKEGEKEIKKILLNTYEEYESKIEDFLKDKFGNEFEISVSREDINISESVGGYIITFKTKASEYKKLNNITEKTLHNIMSELEKKYDIIEIFDVVEEEDKYVTVSGEDVTDDIDIENIDFIDDMLKRILIREKKFLVDLKFYID